MLGLPWRASGLLLLRTSRLRLEPVARTRRAVEPLKEVSRARTLFPVGSRHFHNHGNMAEKLTVELTAPNGRKYAQPTGLFINNEWVASSDGAKITTINPSDESEITSVFAASVDDVDKAVKAARKAFKDPSWRDMPGTERGDLLLKLSALVEKEKETLATIETWDNGMA